MAQETRPSTAPQWTTGGATQVATPTPAQLASGFTTNSRPAYQTLNYLVWNLANWVRYLDQTVIANADITQLTAGVSLSANVPVYVSPGAADGSRTTNAIYALDVSTAGNAVRSQFVGFTSTAVASGATVPVVMGGVLGGFSSLTPGAIYYASPTAGALSTAPPTSAGQFVQAVGVALSPTQLLVTGGRPTQTVNAYKSSIPMGSWGNSGSGITGYTGTTYLVAGNQAGGTTIFNIPCTHVAQYAGSIVGVAYDSSPTQQLSSSTATARINSQNTGATTGSMTSATGYKAFAKGAYTFNAGDVLSVVVAVSGSNPNGFTGSGSAALTVEYSP